MEQVPTKQLERLERLLHNESQIPFTNRLIDDASAEKLSSSWLNKSWSNLLHSDLVEAGEELHYRRLLRAACNDQLPKLKENLEENEYHVIIMDMVDQEYDELEEHGSMNALYLLEMAFELSRFEDDRPAYMELLNMIKLHRLKYGTLENLRRHKPEASRERSQYLKELHEGAVASDNDTTADESEEVKHFKKAVNDIDHVTGFSYINPPPEAEEHIHDEVIRMWDTFEKRVISNISSLLNNSAYMRKIKKYLWQRQEQSETIFDETIAACDDPGLVQEFKETLVRKRPRIRNGMGIKISSRPEIAEKIYGILDRLLAAEVSALKFLEVFEALANAPFDGAICDVQMEIEKDPALISDPDRLLVMLNSFDSRYHDMSSKEKYELSRRQHSAFV